VGTGEGEGEEAQGRVDGDRSEPVRGPVAIPACVHDVPEIRQHSPSALAIEHALGEEGEKGKKRGGGVDGGTVSDHA